MPADTRLCVSPSILSADFARLGDEVRVLETAGVERLHVDVMDGHFVPNLSIGTPVVKSVRQVTKCVLDTHLMITDPAKYAQPFVEAGADSLTFHIEAVEDPRQVIEQIRALGVGVGVSLNPTTPASALDAILGDVDLVLVMTVWPGFGGQSFIADCLPKISALAARMRPEQILQVDGGVNQETIGAAVRAGARDLVAGSAVFRSADSVQAWRGLTDLAQAALRASEAAG